MTADSAEANYSIRDASVNLSRIIERVDHGEEIVISQAGVPVAKVISLRPRVKRTTYGSLAGQLVLDDGWDSASVNADIARDFG